MDTLSTIKTIIAFKDGLILRQMDRRSAAANAVAAFDLFTMGISSGDFKRPNVAIAKKPYFPVLLEASAKWNNVEDIFNVIDEMSEDDQDALVDAMGSFSSDMIDSGSLPVDGLKTGCMAVWEAIKTQTEH